MLMDGLACVITGAGRGIGRYTAETFASHGARLALCARSLDQLDEVRAGVEDRSGTEALVEALDVSEWAAVQRFAAAVHDRFGKADVLVNNAGTYGPIGPLVDASPDEWVRAIRVNLLGVVHGIKAFAPRMVAAGGGRIINVAGAGIGSPHSPTNVGAYSASKAGVVALTETVARELAPRNVHVNAVAPGAIGTALNEELVRAGPERAGPDLHARAVRWREGGDPIEKVGELMLFLASGRSGALTGKLLSAKWDPLDRIAADPDAVNRSSLYALRRIDGVMFGEIEAGGAR